MINEFSRTQLLIGEEGLSKLSSSTVMVFGVGGVGSHCIEALARCGIGRLILVDPDEVALTNINRQSIAYHSTVGQFKTKVMEQRIMDINPAAQVITFERFILPENLEQLFAEIPGTIDYVVDAIDTVAAKLALVEYCTTHEIPLLASMGTGNKLHGELFEITDISKTSVCPLCRVMRRELKSRGIYHLKVLYSKEEPLKPKFESEEITSKRAVPGSISFVPPVAGLLIAGEVIRELSGN
ncbi:MAG: tRNA threonylcarbamoyladenosine dehydratase [Hungatella hathewayi]|nr:tRNA threonylcarbamoyladenosine dehydratase [Hungatella hathewayi]